MTSKMTRVIKFVIGVISWVTVIGIGLLYASVESAVIETQRFLPDQDHPLPLEVKGRIFYVSKTALAQYTFYKDLFLAMVLILLVIVIAIRIWKRYVKDRKPAESQPIRDEQ
jgi:hypothetical protein